uniref:Zinc finger FYVE-type containing 26 n=1 Tax=Laticauda laticaudata TaxID=8630 RepID=A0A8C5SZE2_LATLA
MYPFGREEEASLERLFWFFSECVQRGEWELAQACVPQLQQLQDDGSEKVEKILHTLIICSSRLRSESKHSPQKLAWFWLLVLKEWLSHKQVKKNILVLCRKILSFEDNHLLHRKQRDGSVQKFGVEVMSTLQKMLLQAPRKLQSILELLQRDSVDCSSSVVQSGLPQNVFVGFLWDSLKNLKRLHLNPELLEREGNKIADEIYNAMSMLNLKMDNQMRELRLLCRELLDACWFEQSPLREERLLSCMLRKGSHALLSLFGSVFIEKMKEKLLSQKSPGKGTPEHPNAERVVMALFLDHEQAYSWKAAYFYYLSSNKHFLEQILITALSLLKREDFSSLSRLLTQEFSYLSRLLILLGWTQCCSLESAKMLLETLHKSQGFYNDSVLKDFCDGLCAQVEVLEWCIQQNSNCIPENILLQHLHSLECHSSLYLLYQLTDLLTLNEEAVIELFQKTPTKYTEVQDSAVMPDVRLLSQQHNLTLYQAFCAMKYAIYALCVKAHRGSNCRHCANTDYAALFPHYLSKCQNYLRSIPAPLRLELLENIFSLLFVYSSDLYGDSPQEDNAEDGGFRKKSRLGKRAERCASQDSSTSPSPQHSISPEMTAHAPTSSTPKNSQALFNLESSNRNCGSFGLSYLDLKHFTSNICGFLVDEEALEMFLKMLMEHLKEIEDSFVWDSRHVPTMELALLDSLNLSINRESFNSRMQQFTKYLSEAQWRHRIALSNKNTVLSLISQLVCRCYNENKGICFPQLFIFFFSTSEHKRTSNPSRESSSSELSITSTSEGSAGASSDCSDAEYWIKPPENSLIPAMLSPPESLLVACILKGNYIEAHQVAIMFDLETSASYGELIFLEHYQEVIGELAKVEHKIEHQSPEGSGNLKQSGSGRSTLQAIGNAAAAGMVFYSISDVTDKLLAPSERLEPVLQENFWTSSTQLECTDPLSDVLEDLCPSAMAIFDLASTQCNLWKTCKQLLETAERKLQNSLEIKARRLDSIHQNPNGLKGFPAVLQQISKIINIPQGQPKSEISDEKISCYFHCSIVDLLQTCYPDLTADCITNQLVLSQHLDEILQNLAHVYNFSGNMLASLVEQAFLKSAELEAHPICSRIKHLLKILDQYSVTMPEGYGQTAYLQTFFNYINKLAAIIFRSLTPEIDQSAEIQVGNPFILLQQSPSHLLSQLLFEKQIAPDRLSLLLAKEELNLNVQQVIINCCCKALPLCTNMQNNQTRSLLTNISSLAHLHVYNCLPDIEVPVHNPAMESENTSNNPLSSLPDLNQHSLTASTLNFLKSQSKLIATVACLTALKVQKPPKQSLSWIEFRGKREVPLSMDQISKECEILLKDFPFLETFLLTMIDPLQDPQDKGISLASELCGQSYITLLFLGLHSSMAVEELMETFEQALTAKDWPRALKILDLYSQDMQELITVRDAILSCATADGEDGWQYVFPVRDAVLRSRLALRCLDRWPLEACLEILAYCACDPEVTEELKFDLQSKIKELQVYQKVWRHRIWDRPTGSGLWGCPGNEKGLARHPSQAPFSAAILQASCKSLPPQAPPT